MQIQKQLRKECKRCKAEFWTARKRKKFCGTTCRRNYWREKNPHVTLPAIRLPDGRLAITLERVTVVINDPDLKAA
jgi:hypothetical protein